MVKYEYGSGFKQPLVFIYDDKEFTLEHIIINDRIDVLDYIYTNDLYDTKNFQNELMSNSISYSNFETFKWLHQKFPGINMNNQDMNRLFYNENYQEFIEYIIDNVFYEFIDIDKINYTKHQKQIEYCINNMHRLKLKYSSIMIVRLTNNIDDHRETLDFILQESLDGRLDYSIWSSEKIVDHSTYNNLLWLYDKYKLNLIPFNYTINAIHNSRFSIDKIKWWVDKRDEFSIECQIESEQMSLEVLKYLLEEQNVIGIKLDSDTICDFLHCDQIDILEYLINKKRTVELLEFFDDEKNFYSYGNVETLNWVYSKYKSGLIPFKYTHNTFDNAVTHNYVDIIKWFINNCIENKGELELLQTVDSNNFDFKFVNYTTINYLLTKQDVIKINIKRIIETTNLTYVMDCLYRNYQDEFDITTISNAIDNCHYIPILKWWFNNAIENNGTIDLHYTELSLDNTLKIGYDGIGILKIWYENRFKFTPKFTKEYLISYVNDDYNNRKCYLDFMNFNN
jgi:hypothetical protein